MHKKAMHYASSGYSFIENQKHCKRWGWCRFRQFSIQLRNYAVREYALRES